MGRKRKETTLPDAQPEVAPQIEEHDNAEPDEFEEEAPASVEDEPAEVDETPYQAEEEESAADTRRRISKKEAVKEAMEAGVTSPTQIVGWVKRMYDVEMSVAHVSTVKGILKKERLSRRGRKPRPIQPLQDEELDEPMIDESPTRAPLTSPDRGEAGLTPKDLRALVDMADRVGGIQRLQEFLDVLRPAR